MNQPRTNPKSERRVTSALRDDVKKIIADLAQSYGKKLNALKQLLLSESDKLHYVKSQNYEQMFTLLEADKSIIEGIDVIDFDIARIESGLSGIMGLPVKDLFAHSLIKEEEFSRVLSLRHEITDAITLLYKQRKLLVNIMSSESRDLQKNIDDISRISKLGIPRDD
jgi:hypothetical protein